MILNILGNKTTIDSTLIEASEEEIKRQIEEYGKGERKTFDLKIEFPDSFTGKVMREMVKIPYGETKSYGEIAEALDTAAVAVGQACGRTPVPIIVPCNRVLGKDSLGGYSGGLDLKRKLLSLESS